MQYFPSLLHTMVHRMRFSAFYPSHHSSSSESALARRTAFSEKQKHRTSRGKTSALLPRKHGTFLQRSPRFSISEKTASPPPPHRLPPQKKAHQSITYRNIAHHQPHPKTAKNTPANPKKPHKTHPESVIFRHKAKIFRK